MCSSDLNFLFPDKLDKMLKHTPKDQRFTRSLLAKLAEEQEQLQKAAAEPYNAEDQHSQHSDEDEELDFKPNREDQDLEEEQAAEELDEEEAAAHSHAQFLSQQLDSLGGELEEAEHLEEAQEDLDLSVQKSGYAQKMHLSSLKQGTKDAFEQ